MEKSYDEDLCIVKLKEKAQLNSASGYIAKTLVEWLLADHSRMMLRNDALNVYYEYCTYQNRYGLECLLLFAAQHRIPGFTIIELADAHSKGIKTPFDFFERINASKEVDFNASKEIVNREEVSKAQKMLAVFQTPDEERKRTTVARMRSRLNRRKK